MREAHRHRHTCTGTHAQAHMHRHTCTHAQAHMHRHTCSGTHAQARRQVHHHTRTGTPRAHTRTSTQSAHRHINHHTRTHHAQAHAHIHHHRHTSTHHTHRIHAQAPPHTHRHSQHAHIRTQTLSHLHTAQTQRVETLPTYRPFKARGQVSLGADDGARVTTVPSTGACNRQSITGGGDASQRVLALACGCACMHHQGAGSTRLRSRA